MKTLQKKWLIILQGLFFALAGGTILIYGFDKTIVALLLMISALTANYFLTINKGVASINVYRSMLTIEIIMTLISSILFFYFGDNIAHFVLVFGIFSLFFGVIPFFFLFGILSSKTKLRFDMAKFRLIGGVISMIFGFYLIAVKHDNFSEIVQYIGVIMGVIGLSVIFGFRLSQKQSE